MDLCRQSNISTFYPICTCPICTCLMITPHSIQHAFFVLQNTNHTCFWPPHLHPGAPFFPLPSAYQYPDQSSGLSLRPFLHESFSNLSLTSLNFCFQIIGMFRVNGFVCVGFPSTALLWKLWMECLSIHISSLPSACPDLAQQVHRTLYQRLWRGRGCHEAATEVRAHCASEPSLKLLLLGMLSSSSTSCAVLEDLMIFLSNSSSVYLYISHDFSPVYNDFCPYVT